MAVLFCREHETNTKRTSQRNNSNHYKIRICATLCILSETPNGTANETADGTQKENVNNIVVVLLYNNIIFYLLLKYNQSILLY